jgi:cell division septation protein DedD
MLQIALELDPNYDDAMAYMNLLDRLKAGLVNSPAESADLVSKADDWVGKALTAKRQHARSQPPGPAQLDVDGPPPGPANAAMLVAPPPPPPPPPPSLAAPDNQLASASPLPTPRNAAERPESFWQVMGGADMSANALVRLLKDKGFSAILVSSQDHLVRVMAGPYTDSQSLEGAKGALEAAGFHPIRTW